MNSSHLKTCVGIACSGPCVLIMTLRAVLRHGWMLRCMLTCVTGITVVIGSTRYLARILPVRMTLVAAQRSMNSSHLKTCMGKTCSGPGILGMSLHAILRYGRMMRCMLARMTGITVVIGSPRYLARILPVRMALVTTQRCMYSFKLKA